MAQSIQQGIDALIKAIEQSKKKPVVVAVHALGPDHGKTYFIHEALKRLEELGKEGEYTNDYDSEGGYQFFQQDLDAYLLHIGVEYRDKDSINEKVREYAGGRDINVHVFVYNPTFVERWQSVPSEEDFDIVIKNTGSIRKKIKLPAHLIKISG